jgi:S1-C subfamily serine protease
LAYGTVVGDGHQILTKWSEVDKGKNDLIVEAASREALPAKIVQVYENEDLAVLEIAGEPLEPVVWSNDQLTLGSFLATPQPDGRLAGFGVLSVAERNLRETDQAFLGVMGEIGFKGPGVKVREVTPKSAAEIAGIKMGDVILKVGDRQLSGVMELKSSLVGIDPGSKVQLKILRESKEQNVDVLLGNRPQFSVDMGDRLAMMEQMGTQINRVRSSFANAVQTDMQLQPDQVGGPVVDLQANVVGITVARADRTKSFVMSSTAVKKLLETPGKDPALAKLAVATEGADPRVMRVQPGGRGERRASPERLQRHLDEMHRLMEFMQQELEDLGGK